MSDENFGPVGSALVLLQADLESFRTSIQRAAPEIEKIAGGIGEKSSQAFSQAWKTVGANLSTVGRSLSLALTAPLVGVAAFASKTAIDYESAFAGVRKTVSATESQLQGLSDGFRQMSKEIPASAAELARLAETAGQLGIKVEDISKFTRVMSDLGTATNLSADEAATAVAKIQNIFGAAGVDTDRFGAALVALGNFGASTEQEIVAMATRIAGAAHVVGLSQSQVLAFANALSSVGIEAEAGGSAISRVMIEISTQVETAGKKLPLFASVVGKSVKDFSDSFRKDAAGSLVGFIEALGGMEAKGKSSLVVLQELGLNEIRVRDALLRAAGAGDLFRQSLDLGSKAWSQNTALTAEAEQRYKTTASQLKIFWNQLQDVGITLGGALLPALRSTLDAVKPLIASLGEIAKIFSELPPGVQTTAIALAALAAAIGPLIAGMGFLVSGLGSAIPLLIQMSAAVTTAGGVGPAVSALGASLIGLAGPAGILVVAGAAVVAATIIFLRFRDRTHDVTDQIDRMKSSLDSTKTAAERFAEIEAKASAGQLIHVNELTMAQAAAKQAAKDLASQQQAQGIAAQQLGGDLKGLVIHLDETAAGTKALGKAHQDHAKDVVDDAKASETFRTAVDGLKDSVTGAGTTARQLVTAIRELSSAHVSASVIANILGTSITGVVKALGEEGKAVDPVLQSMAEYVRLKDTLPDSYTRQQDAEKLTETTLGLVDDATKKLIISLTELNNVPPYSAPKLPLDLYGLFGIKLGEIKLGEDMATTAAREHKKALDDEADAMQRAIDSVKQSAGHIFDDLRTKGESVFTSLRNALKGGALSLGRAIFVDVTGMLLGPLKKAFDDFFAALLDGLGIKKFLTGLGESLANVLTGNGGKGGLLSKIPGLGGVFGAGAATAATAASPVAGTLATGAIGIINPATGALVTGAAAGGTAAAGTGTAAAAGTAGAGGGAGATLAAFATNPVTIAAAAAIAGALIIHHFVGEGRRTANEFVQGTENPFGSNLSQLVDTFDRSKAAGILTLDDAKKTKDALQQLWTAYKASGEAFAAQGKNEAKVWQQSLAHLTEIFGPNLSRVFDGIETTIGDLSGKTPVPSKAATAQGIPGTGVAQTASTVFASAVDTMVAAIDKLVLALTAFVLPATPAPADMPAVAADQTPDRLTLNLAPSLQERTDVKREGPWAGLQSLVAGMVVSVQKLVASLTPGVGGLDVAVLRATGTEAANRFDEPAAARVPALDLSPLLFALTAGFGKAPSFAFDVPAAAPAVDFASFAFSPFATAMTSALDVLRGFNPVGAGSSTENLTVNYVFNNEFVFNGVPDNMQQLVRDQVMPAITDNLRKNSRGVTAEWQTVLRNREKGII